MKKGLIAASVMVALVACSQGDQQAPPSASTTGWESTQAGSEVPQATQTQPETIPTLTTQPPGEAKRISIEELKRKVADGSAVVVDVRDAQSFAFQHAEGAISIPLDQVAARASELPRGKQIVTYCT
jgi:hypothetical protein